MNYDVIIIGQALSGITAGALLSRKNLRVLVLPGPWSPPPPVRPLPEPSGPVLAFLEKLRVTDMISQHKPDELVSQIIMGEHRLDWYNNRVSLSADIKREFGEEAEEARRFITKTYETGNESTALLARMPLVFFDGMFSQRKMRKAVADFFPEELSKPDLSNVNTKWFSAFRAQMHWASFLPESLPNIFYTSLFSILAPGIANREINTVKLKNILRDRISMSRGRCMDNVRVKGLAFDGRKLIGVSWEGDTRFFAGRQIIWSEPPKALLDLLPDKMRTKKGFAELEALVPLGYWATYRFRVDERAIPTAMSERLAFIEMGEKTPALLQLEEDGPTGDTVFNLSLFVEYQGRNDNERWLAIQKKIELALKKVSELVPYATFKPCAGSREEIMRSLFPVYPPSPDCPLGLTAFSPFTPVPNLLLGGPQIWPAMGLVGELMLGQQLAKICIEKLSK